MDAHELETVFDTSSSGTVYLLKTLPDEYLEAIKELIRQGQSQGYDIIYIGMKRPYTYFQKSLKEAGIPEDGVYMIDAITKTITEKGQVMADNVAYINSPQQLTNIGTTINLMTDKSGNNNIVVLIDSLETMLTYNTESAISRFLEDIRDRTQTLELSLCLFKPEEELSEKIGADLYSVINEVLLLSAGEDETIEVTTMGTSNASIEVPADIARSLDWKKGDELDFDVRATGELVLRKE